MGTVRVARTLTPMLTGPCPSTLDLSVMHYADVLVFLDVAAPMALMGILWGSLGSVRNHEIVTVGWHALYGLEGTTLNLTERECR